jgi:hypothetical protein
LAFGEVLEGRLAALLQAAESCGEHGLEEAVGLGPRRCEQIRAAGYCSTRVRLTQGRVAMQTDGCGGHARAASAVRVRRLPRD